MSLFASVFRKKECKSAVVQAPEYTGGDTDETRMAASKNIS